MGVFSINPSRRTTLSQFADILNGIDAKHLTYQSQPSQVVDMRARFLRPIEVELTLAHVEQQLGDLLDVGQFLQERGLSDIVSAPKRNSHVGSGDIPATQHDRKQYSSSPPPSAKKWLGLRLTALSTRDRSQIVSEISPASAPHDPDNDPDSQSSPCSSESSAFSLNTCSGGYTTSESSAVPTPEIPRRKSLQPETQAVELIDLSYSINDDTFVTSFSQNGLDHGMQVPHITMPAEKPARRNSLLAGVDRGTTSYCPSNDQVALPTLGFSPVHAVYGNKPTKPARARKDSAGFLMSWLS